MHMMTAEKVGYCRK